MVESELLGKIQHISLRPIKGCASIDVQEALLTENGLAGDHDFVVVSAKPVDGAHEFVSQAAKRDDNRRAEGTPLLAKIKPEFKENSLWVTFSGKDAIEIPSNKDTGDETRIRIWKDETVGINQGKLLNEWFSDHLGLEVKLVKASGPFQRLSRKQPVDGKNGLRTQDGYPILWFTEASLKELSDKAQQNIPFDRFRPQIVVSGMPIQAEHRLSVLKINGIIITNEKPCVRCPVTMVDQVTGVFSGPEPLRSLAKYKMLVQDGVKKGVVFGENANPHGHGRICVGDQVNGIELRKSPPNFIGSK